MPEELVNAMADLKEQKALDIVRKKIDAGEDPLKILKLFREAMGIVGKRFENMEYFIPDLVMAGGILNQGVEIVQPKLGKSARLKNEGIVVLGTVQGDIHDIGKDLVKFMLEANGFEVRDLGVDVPPQKFVDEIKKAKPTIVALSGFLHLAYDSMKKTVESIKQAGLREKVKIMIGGGQIDENILKHTGADAYGKDAAEAVSISKKWMKG